MYFQTCAILFAVMHTNCYLIEELFSFPYNANMTSNSVQRRSSLDQPIQRHDEKYILCYECSSFPYEEDSLDELLGPCPGWRRPPKQYGVGGSGSNTIGSSIYDGCMTIVLSNASIVSQNAIVFSQCLKYKSGSLSSNLYDIFGMPSKVYCCKGSLCNGPAAIRNAIFKGLGINHIKVRIYLKSPIAYQKAQKIVKYKVYISLIIFVVYIVFRILHYIIQSSI